MKYVIDSGWSNRQIVCTALCIWVDDMVTSPGLVFPVRDFVTWSDDVDKGFFTFNISIAHSVQFLIANIGSRPAIASEYGKMDCTFQWIANNWMFEATLAIVESWLRMLGLIFILTHPPWISDFAVWNAFKNWWNNMFVKGNAWHHDYAVRAIDTLRSKPNRKEISSIIPF